MTTFIHTADLHLGLRQYGLAERFRDMARTFGAVAGLAIAEGAQFILISGDLFDSRSISPPTYMQATRVLERLRDAGVKVFAIEGNHDQYYHRDSVGWLHSLEGSGLLELIKVREWEPGEGDGDVGLMGDFRDHAGARIFGMRYIGASTKRELGVIADEITRVNSSLGKPEVTILMMHFGMEGQLKHSVGGEIPYGALSPLRGVVDYLALGHYHMKYDYEGWVFNPGSPEMVRMDEYGLDKGVYLHRDGETRFIPSAPVMGTRPFHRVRVDLDSRGRGGKPAPDTPVDRRTLTPSMVTEKAVEAAKGQRDAVARKVKAAEEAGHWPGGPKDGKEMDEGSRAGLLEPVVEVDLRGRLGFPRTELDMEGIGEKVAGILGALHVNVRLLSREEEHSVPLRDLRGNTLRQVEARVLREKILLDRRYRSHPAALVDGMMEVKDLVLASAEPSIILEKLRETYDGLGGADTDGGDTGDDGERVEGTGPKKGPMSLDDFQADEN